MEKLLYFSPEIATLRIETCTLSGSTVGVTIDDSFDDEVVITFGKKHQTPDLFGDEGAQETDRPSDYHYNPWED